MVVLTIYVQIKQFYFEVVWMALLKGVVVMKKVYPKLLWLPGRNENANMMMNQSWCPRLWEYIERHTFCPSQNQALCETWHEVADQLLIFYRVSKLHRIKTIYLIFLSLSLFLFSILFLIAFSPSLSSTLSPQSLSLYSSHPPTIPFLTPRWWRWWSLWWWPSPSAGCRTTSTSSWRASTRLWWGGSPSSRSTYQCCGWPWAPQCTTPSSIAASTAGRI